MTDFFLNENQKTAKMSKTDVLIKDFDDECVDPAGVEKGLTSGLVGKISVKLCNLSPSPNLALPVNQRKVSSISQSMLSRFDVSACVLTICVADDNENPDLVRYHVLHGVHRILALQKIEAEEPHGVAELPGLKNKKVDCVLVGSSSAVIHNYAQLRGNDIAASHTTKPCMSFFIFISI